MKVLLSMLVTAPVLYLVSVGPVAYMHIHHRWFSAHFLDTLYAPMKFLPKTPLISTPMKSYMELWLGPVDDDGAGSGG